MLGTSFSTPPASTVSSSIAVNDPWKKSKASQCTVAARAAQNAETQGLMETWEREPTSCVPSFACSTNR